MKDPVTGCSRLCQGPQLGASLVHSQTGLARHLTHFSHLPKSKGPSLVGIMLPAAVDGALVRDCCLGGRNSILGS